MSAPSIFIKSPFPLVSKFSFCWPLPLSGLFLLEMSRFISSATWWSGSDRECPIMGSSCIFHWVTDVCFGDSLGNRCNLRQHCVYFSFHWYAEYVWNQRERKTNTSEESTCMHSLFPRLSPWAPAKSSTHIWTHTLTSPQLPWFQQYFPFDIWSHMYLNLVSYFINKHD